MSTPEDEHAAGKAELIPSGGLSPALQSPPTSIGAEAGFAGGPSHNPAGAATPTPADDADGAAETADAPPSIAPVTPPQAASAPAPDTGFPPLRAPRAAVAGRVAIGSVLNGIYEVKRFIARGGMGEVYEGVSIAGDERVAIKIMLPQLASDPYFQAMFMREARTLTSLHHPAIVQYRVVAQEPALGLLYIVTEYIDGPSLAEEIKTLKPQPRELAALIRRLAEGLAAAHELGKFHRDISPDNILLPAGRLDRAKIIDFGIAKDTDPSNQTVVGAGFAGKLGFVAPEQFGDFNYKIGPWTDIYSLGLVALAVANGEPLDMGATLVEALDRRRKGPNLDGAPEVLRPLLRGMTAADPADRPSSMADVIAAIDAAPLPKSAAATSPGLETPMIAPFWANLTATWQAAMRPPIVFIGGGVLALMAIVLAAGLLWRKPNAVSAPGTTPDSLRLVDPKAGPTPTLTASAVKSLALRAADGVGCAWLDLDMEPPGAHGYQISLSGVAADAAAASTAISRALHGAGVNAEVTADGVHALQPQACPVIDALRASRQPHDEAPLISTAAAALDSTGAVYHLENRPSGCDLLPEPRQARIVASIDVGQASDFTLIGVEANGKLQQLIPSRSVFDQYIKSEPKYYQRLGRGKLQFTPCIDEVTARSTPEGLSGLLLVAGRGPFGLAPLNDKDSKAMPANWPAKFQTSAAARNWKSQIAWFRVEP